MCGICGFTGATEADAPTLKAMCDIMAHRGPDGEGQYLADGVALGHRRLSLIDLENGSQPMVRATGAHDSIVTSPATEGSAPGSFTIGDYAIVFNGEIYNYRDLRDELAADGWTFKTESDTETLLVSYLAWGKLLLDKVRGMFAFAIWDKQRGELFCARDFFGIKPFYYTVQNGEAGSQFIFASEIKCILEMRIHRRDRSRRAHVEGHVRHHGAPRPRRRGPVPCRRRGAGASAPVAHRPRERQPAHGARHGRA